jgi:hypothetical protein
VLVRDDGQAMTAPRAAGLNDILAVARPHAGAKAVDAQTAAVLGLKGTLHNSCFLVTMYGCPFNGAVLMAAKI